MQHVRFVALSNILQNQYYDINRYIIYQKNHFKIIVLKYIILLISIFLLKFNIFFSLFYLVLFFENIPSKIKKFQITPRIVRQFIIFEILNLFNLVFFFTLKNNIMKILIIDVYNIILYWISFFISYTIEYFIQIKNIKKAQKKLKMNHIIFVAITGSYGKTSCKNYITSFLKQKYNVLQTPKSYNTLNGILKTINEKLMPYHEIFVAEIGVDKINGMNKYIKSFPINIAVVTRIGNQHLKTFKNITNIKNEKTKLLKSALDFAIINMDDSYLKDVAVNCTKITVSTQNTANILIKLTQQNLTQSLLEVRINNQKYDTYTKLLGLHNIENIACAVGVAKALNIDDKIILNTIKKLKNVEHRLSTLRLNNWLILDDSYNSNFIGFCNALDILNQAKNKKVIITPGIIEQGKNNYQNEILAKKIEEIADIILLVKNPSFGEKISSKLDFKSFIEAYNYLHTHYYDQELTILIENDLPDIYIK